jgi:protein dithiol oxidoreductase (disulfide-forming)
MTMITRRDFSLATAAAALSGSALAQGPTAAAAPTEGRDYVRLNTPVPVPAGGKIDVIEFFSYGCPHCYTFEPMLEQWVKRLPADVAFRRIPATFNAPFEGYARLYYALEAIGQADALTRQVFAAIHVQRQRLDKEADIAAFVNSHGGDGLQVIRRRDQIAPGQTGLRGLQDRWGADLGHSWPLVHLRLADGQSREVPGRGRLPDSARAQTRLISHRRRGAAQACG